MKDQWDSNKNPTENESIFDWMLFEQNSADEFDEPEPEPLPGSILNHQFYATVFPNRSAQSKRERIFTLRSLKWRLERTFADQKHCPSPDFLRQRAASFKGGSGSSDG